MPLQQAPAASPPKFLSSRTTTVLGRVAEVRSADLIRSFGICLLDQHLAASNVVVEVRLAFVSDQPLIEIHLPKGIDRVKRFMVWVYVMRWIFTVTLVCSHVEASVIRTSWHLLETYIRFHVHTQLIAQLGVPK